MAKIIAFLVLVCISTANAATIHTVGDSSGWNTGFDYDTWSSGITFTTGDTLTFTYNPSHALSEVTKADYDSCNTRGTAILQDSASPTQVPLTTAGTRYFICPRSNHCSQGMKLTVNTVAASGSTTPSPPTGTTTPSPPTGTTTPSTPTGTTTPPPTSHTPSGSTTNGGYGSNDATSNLLNMSLMVGVVLAAFLGLMV